MAVEAFGTGPRLVGFWEPVARALGREGCVLVAASSGSAQLLPAGFDVVTPTFQDGWSECRQWIRRRIGRWRLAVSEICQAHSLSPSAPEILVGEIVGQVFGVAKASALVEALRPASYLSLWDQGSFGGPLCAAMNVAGVPTFTMIHGAIGRGSMSDFTPLLARNVLVWGDRQRRLFLEAGVPGDAIHVVGCQRLPKMREDANGPRRETLAAIGLSGDGPVILVGMTVLRTTERGIWVEALDALVSAMPEARFLVRLHPSNQRAQFPGLLAGRVGVRVLESHELPLDESIGLADLVLVDSSTLGFDALCLGCPVAVLDPYPYQKSQDVMREVIEEGVALYARDPLALASSLKAFLEDDEERRRMAEAARGFVKDYVSCRGAESVRLVARTVLSGSAGRGVSHLESPERA